MEGRNIALIGFRATGKTEVGKALGEKLGRVFMDMDRHLQACAGRDIACWVRSDGWESFRRAESELLGALGEKRGLVVATGGGVVCDPANREILKNKFFTVWLTATSGTIISRMRGDLQSGSTRPPLTDLPMMEEIEKLLDERARFYSQSADLVLETDGAEIEGLVNRIVGAADRFQR